MRHLLERASYGTIRLFWPMFLATALACVAWSVRSVRRWSSGRPLVKVGTSTAVLIAVAAPLLTFVLAGADFAYHDDDVLLPHSVAHRFFPIAIWPQQGRYFPLFSQEFNAISLISTAPLAYYGFIALQLIVLCILLNMVLSDVAVWWRVVATASILYASGTAILFAEAVYPERNIVFWLLVMILALKRFDVRPSRLNMAAALLAAQIAMYYKEPVFLLVASVAIIRLVSALRGTGRVSRRSLSSRPLELGLLAIAVIFAGQLLALLLGSGSSQYVENGSVGPATAAALYFRMDPLLVVFAAGIVIRLVRRRRAPHLDPVWDAFGVGGVVYFLALVTTGLASDRYLGPVDMIAVLFTIRQASALWAERPRVRGWTVAAALVVTVTTLGGGAFRLIEHTSVVSGTSELADFVSDYTSTHEGTVRLYFPSSHDWRIMNRGAAAVSAPGGHRTGPVHKSAQLFRWAVCVVDPVQM